jgi:hypothetical protein
LGCTGFLRRLARFVAKIPRPKISLLPVPIRVIAIARVPVRFLINGIALTIGQSEVESAIAGAKQATMLSEVSRAPSRSVSA